MTGTGAQPGGSDLPIAISLLKRLAIALALLLAAFPAAAVAAGIAIIGGTLHTLEDDAPRQGMTLLIADGRVRAVGTDLQIPAGYERIDATGKVVTPVIHGGAEAWKVADLLAAERVPVIVDVLDNLPGSYDRLGARLDNATMLWRAGVPVSFTAENTHNAGLLRQIAGNAVAEGMPWNAALAALTRAPAEAYRLGAGVGTLTVGAPADVVIWNGDPLELSTWAEQVMIGGAWISMESRQTRLLERYRTLEGDEPFGYR